MSKERILIVEDKRVTASHLQMSLEQLGYDASHVASTGEEAVHLAHEFRPDLILMDVSLGGELDGVDAAQQIRSTADVAIIYLSAYTDDRVVERAKKTEPYGYLVKPFRTEELRTTIEMALFKHKIEQKLRRSQERLKLALEGGNLGLWDWHIETGEMIFSRRSAEMIEYSEEEDESHIGSWGKHVDPEDIPGLVQAFNEHVQGRTSLFDCECRVRCKAGEWRWSLVRGKVVERNQEGIPLRMTGTCLDITDQKSAEEEIRRARDELEERVEERTQELVVMNEHLKDEMSNRLRAEEELRRSEERYRTLVEDSFDGIFVEQAGKIIFANPRLSDILRFEHTELEGLTHASLYHPDDQETAQKIAKSLAEEKVKSFQNEMRMRRQDGSAVEVELHARGLALTGQQAVQVCVRDITERKRAERETEKLVEDLQGAIDALHYNATHDALTSLLNRAAIVELLIRELVRAGRQGSCLGVIMADIDNFKLVNDSYGHVFGDKVLSTLGQTVGKTIRPYDAAGRWGGDEFIIVLPGCNRDKAKGVAERLRDKLRTISIQTPEVAFNVTTSFGVTSMRGAKIDDKDSLVGAADAALYRAKRAGRDRVEVWEDRNFS